MSDQQPTQSNLTRRECFGLFAAGAVSATGLISGCVRAAQDASARSEAVGPYRNLVFILVDDLGAIDLACSGSDYYRTPHIDALAKRGVRFTQAYAASGVCSPTRASIVTGRYPHRSRITTYIPGPAHRPYAKLLPPTNARTLSQNETGYAACLKDSGIRSLHVGKWHLGRRSPEQLGFDETFELTKVHSDQDPWAVSRYTDRLCRFIRDRGDQRFLAVLSHHTVHVPLYEKPANIKRWTDVPPGENGQNNPTMAAMIESLDNSVGQVMRTLKQTGRENDTAVVFFSDNGGLPAWRPPGADGPVTATSNKPLRGGKSQLYEGGIRVPLIIAAPGLTDRGTTCDVPVISNDLAPTMLSLLGARPQQAQHLDGMDLVPLLRGRTLPHRNLFWYYPHYQALAPHAAVRSGDWKLVHFYETDRSELYHLPTDIGEQRDLAGELPLTAALLGQWLDGHLKHLNSPQPLINPDFQHGRDRVTVAHRPNGEIPAVVTTPDPFYDRSLVGQLRKRGSAELRRVVEGPAPR